MDQAAFHRHLERTWAIGPGRVEVGEAHEVMLGLDWQLAGSAYDWHGRGRRVDPRGHEAIFQYTVDGWGLFGERPGRERRMRPGMLFVTTTPSDHHYLLPAGSPGWRCWWVQILHPFVVERVRRTLADGPGALALDGGSALAAQLLALTALVRRGSPAPLALEQAMVMVAFAHAQEAAEAGSGPGARLRAALRARVLADPSRPPSVEALASDAELSPTAYGHRFRSATGETPWRFVTAVRLELVRRLLVEGDDTLASIAARTGFADANHLCKAWRRRFHESPGALRRRLAGG